MLSSGVLSGIAELRGLPCRTLLRPVTRLGRRRLVEK